MISVVELGLFEQVAEAVRSSVSDELGEVHSSWHRSGCKVWFATTAAPKEHYEAQLVARRHLDGGAGVVVEVGFHAEHRDEAANVAVLERLTSASTAKRKPLGGDAVAGPFLGNGTWRRYSETIPDPDPDDPDLVLELADRLTTFIEVLEPIRRATTP